MNYMRDPESCGGCARAPGYSKKRKTVIVCVIVGEERLTFFFILPNIFVGVELLIENVSRKLYDVSASRSGDQALLLHCLRRYLAARECSHLDSAEVQVHCWIDRPMLYVELLLPGHTKLNEDRLRYDDEVW